MPFIVSIDQAQRDFPDYTFVSALTPSEFKAAFHVTDAAGNHLCLKIINPASEVNRVKREILALQGMTHPNLAKLIEYTYSSKQGQQTHFMIEEYVEGTDLAARLGAPWSLDDILPFFRMLYEGLDELRRKGLVHRDLKPNNIRVRTNGSPVIIDFGLVRHLGLPDLTQTIDGAAIGTPRYFTPEQCRGNKYDIDHRTDLFASGVLLFEALTGEHPFHQTQMTRQELYDAICDEERWRNNATWGGLSAQWKLLTGRLLAKERSERPYNAEQVLHMLDKLGGTA